MAETRGNKLVRILAASGIAIVLAAGGVTGDYYLNPSIDLGAVQVTQYEYEQIKPELVAEIKQMSFQDPLTLTQRTMWINAADIEIKKCGGIRLDTSKDFVTQINDVLENGCP